MPPSSKPTKPDLTRDLDHNGLVDALDDRSRDLDRDGVIDTGDRPQKDLNHDNLIDGTDQQQQAKNNVGTDLGWTKNQGSWTPLEAAKTQQQSQSHKTR